jgi:hypothetical protein
MSIFSLSSLWIIFISQVFVSPEPPFQLVNQEGTITLYERWIKTGGAEVRELKAVFEVHAPLERVLPLLQDKSPDHGWDYGADHHVMNSLPGQSGWQVYMRYDMPWPMHDQDCLLSFQPHQISDRMLQIPFRSMRDNRFPESNTRDRISGVRGQWTIVSEGNGRLKITYQVSSDRSKKIPRWVSDPVVHAHLLESLHSFTLKLERS